jgi:hypothetical protein
VFFAKIPWLGIIRFKEIIFLLKILWNMSTVSWTGSTVLRSTGLRRSLNADHPRCDLHLRLIQTTDTTPSNRSRSPGRLIALRPRVGDAPGSERRCAMALAEAAAWGSGAWKATRLRAKQRAVCSDSYLGQRWKRAATAAACDGGATPPSPGVDDSSPRCTSNTKDGSYGFLTSYSCFPELQLHWWWRNQVTRRASFKP